MIGKLIKTNLNIGQNLWEMVEEDTPEDVFRDEFVKLVNHLVDPSDLTIYGDLTGWALNNKESLFQLSRRGFGTHYEALGLACELVDRNFDSATKDGYRVSKIGEEGLFFRVEESGGWEDICGMTMDEFREYRILVEKGFNPGNLQDFSIECDKVTTPQNTRYSRNSSSISDITQFGKFYTTNSGDSIKKYKINSSSKYLETK